MSINKYHYDQTFKYGLIICLNKLDKVLENVPYTVSGKDWLFMWVELAIRGEVMSAILARAKPCQINSGPVDL